MKPLNFVRILALVGALAAYSAWSLSVKERRTSLADGDVVAGTDIRLVRLPEAAALWKESGTLFLDVRPQVDYEFGHVAGAIHFPEPEFEQRFPELKPRLERAQTIVVYCKSTDCGLSLWAAIRLRNEGLKQAAIFPGGWNEWVNGGLPVARSRDQ